MDATAVSIVPVRTDDAETAARAYRDDGAVVVTGHGTDEGSLTALLHDVFGERLVNVGEAVPVRAAGGRDRPDLDTEGHTMRTPLHSDGFALAEGAPDVIALGCEHAATDGGGASFVVSADAVLAAVDPTMATFLTGTAIDQTEPGKLPMVGPVGERAGEGDRTVWRCSYYLKPAADDPDRDATQQRIDDWLWLLEDLGAAAARFHLVDGDVLICDNTRTFHGRDPYVDTDRLLWRLWAWTADAPRPTTYRGSDTSLVEAP